MATDIKLDTIIELEIHVLNDADIVLKEMEMFNENPLEYASPADGIRMRWFNNDDLFLKIVQVIALIVI